MSAAPLRIYWHLWLVNHWREVVAEQLAHLRNTGLHERAASIRLSICAEPEQLRDLPEILAGVSKLEFAVISRDPCRFEFPALEILYTDARTSPPFSALYCHTKGVSYADKSRDRWRMVLNEGVLVRWREHLAALAEGFDVSGQNYLSPESGFTPHFSGNFWFARSDYLTRLRPPSTLPQADRYAAEMWLCALPHRAHSSGWVEHHTPPAAAFDTTRGK